MQYEGKRNEVTKADAVTDLVIGSNGTQSKNVNENKSVNAKCNKVTSKNWNNEPKNCNHS